jgi:hypothetical protein
MTKGAEISECGRYRWKLWRIWDDSKAKVLFIMHNPSTADAEQDDPTIRRCIGFAKTWGYGGIYVGNLFPFRATDPKELLKQPFDIVYPGMENWKHTNEMVGKCKLHILAYGNPAIKDCIPELFDRHWHYLKMTKAGNPCHPLYLKSDFLPIKINSEE